MCQVNESFMTKTEWNHFLGFFMNSNLSEEMWCSRNLWAALKWEPLPSDMAMNPNNVECFNIFTLRPLVILIPLGHSKVIWYTSFFLFFFIHFSLIYTIKIIMLMRGVLARTAFIARVILERITLNYFSLYAQLFPQSCRV